MRRSVFIYVIPLLFFYLGLAPAVTLEEIEWYSLEKAQTLAEEDHKKVLIFAEAKWCTYCKKMDNEVFPKKAVIQTMEKYFYPVRLDVESDKKITFNGQEMTERQFAQKHRVTATPTTFFIKGDGEILGTQPGFVPAKVFKTLLSYIGTNAYGEVEFETYMQQEGGK